MHPYYNLPNTTAPNVVSPKNIFKWIGVLIPRKVCYFTGVVSSYVQPKGKLWPKIAALKGS